jgi:hypothetical protein
MYLIFIFIFIGQKHDLLKRTFYAYIVIKKNFDYLCKGPPSWSKRQKKLFQGMTIHTPIESPD